MTSVTGIAWYLRFKYLTAVLLSSDNVNENMIVRWNKIRKVMMISYAK